MTEYSVTDIMYRMIVQLMTHNFASLYSDYSELHYWS